MTSPQVMKHSREFPVPLEHAFDVVLHCSLPDVFANRHHAIPPIREVRDQDGSWGIPGDTRTIVLTDGGSMVEELMTVERPRRFSYKIREIKGLMKPIVAHAEGVWTFERIGDGTRITWQWTVHPSNAVMALVTPLLARMWQGYACRGMQELSTELQASYAGTRLSA